VPDPGATPGTTRYLREDGAWQAPPNTTYSVFVGSGPTHATGLVPDPGATPGTTRYLREDGAWQAPPDTNTTYAVFVGSGASHAAGLVPDPGATPGTAGAYRWLREDGTWQTDTVPDQITNRGTLNVRVDMVPNTQWKGTIATGSSLTWDVAVTSGRQQRLTGDCWVNTAAPAFAYTKAILAWVQNVAGTIAIAGQQPLGEFPSPNTSGYTFTCATSPTAGYVRFTLTNNSGATGSVSFIASSIGMDQP
jgi:hypothetical protein